jgi:hypothetical protein
MATTELKLCQLQVNVGTGAWRTVMDFEEVDNRYVMTAAKNLFVMGHTHSIKGIRLRIMKPGDTRPLLNWSEQQGWQAWDKGVI